MRKYRLTVAFEGTHYAGWQTQKSGVGVQQKLEEALGRLFPSRPIVHSSSRTDTGVHAQGMVVHVVIPTAECRIPVRKLLLALNAHLPEDIRVMSVGGCAKEFHARFDARGKQYRYYIWNHPALHPLWRHMAWHVPQTLDFAAMKAASRHFLGQQDFRSLAASRNYPFRHTVRTLTRCQWQRRGPLLTCIIEGDGFLYKMCRGLVGTLVQVGQSKIPPEDVPGILAGKDRRLAGMTAPAHGLVLWRVYYR